MPKKNSTSLSFDCAELVHNENDVTISKITTSNNKHILVIGDATDEGRGSLIERLDRSLVINEVCYPIIEPQESCNAPLMQRLEPYMQYSSLVVATIYAAVMFAFDGFKGM